VVGGACTVSVANMAQYVALLFAIPVAAAGLGKAYQTWRWQYHTLFAVVAAFLVGLIVYNAAYGLNMDFATVAMISVILLYAVGLYMGRDIPETEKRWYNPLTWGARSQETEPPPTEEACRYVWRAGRRIKECGKAGLARVARVFGPAERAVLATGALPQPPPLLLSRATITTELPPPPPSEKALETFDAAQILAFGHFEKNRLYPGTEGYVTHNRQVLDSAIMHGGAMVESMGFADRDVVKARNLLADLMREKYRGFLR